MIVKAINLRVGDTFQNNSRSGGICKVIHIKYKKAKGIDEIKSVRVFCTTDDNDTTVFDVAAHVMFNLLSSETMCELNTQKIFEARDDDHGLIGYFTSELEARKKGGSVIADTIQTVRFDGKLYLVGDQIEEIT